MQSCHNSARICEKLSLAALHGTGLSALEPLHLICFLLYSHASPWSSVSNFYHPVPERVLEAREVQKCRSCVIMCLSTQLPSQLTNYLEDLSHVRTSNICVYVCVCVCTYGWMDGWHACTHECFHVCKVIKYVCMHASTCVRWVLPGRIPYPKSVLAVRQSQHNDE